MATSKRSTGAGYEGGSVEEARLQGRIDLEGVSGVPGELDLAAYVFDQRGQLIGMGTVSQRGEFSVAIKLTKTAIPELVIAPKSELELIGKSAVYRAPLGRADFGEKPPYLLTKDLFITKAIWYPWLPTTVCVSGRVRKVTQQGACPVPFVKVEIFDVDREACWWPPILTWWDQLLDKTVVNAINLLKERPYPPVGPGPVERMGVLSERVQLNPQPLPPHDWAALNPQPLPPRDWAAVNPQPLPPRDWASLDPQPLPPVERAMLLSNMQARATTAMAAGDSNRLQDLVISSKVAPWLIFPGCFYSKALVCETTTDCDGEFQCCFRWYPWHFRRGRLRFDLRPDILVRVTQVIGGVETVIYLDPYTSTRWNASSAYIDLTLNDEAVVCGSGCRPHPTGSDVFFTLIGLDEVYKINQVSGQFSNLAFGGAFDHWAYGGWLLACALFGQGLSNGSFYYRLSYRKGVDPFKPINYPISDTRVDKISLTSDVHTLGPQTVNGTPNLYEIRDMLNYYWYNPDKIGWWNTEADEPDSGLYTLRLEVFNSSGVLLTSATVNYLNGAVPPPGPLPPMLDHCDLNVLVDNRYPTINLGVVGASGECGVVPCSNRGSLAVLVNVNQVHSRLWSWGLSYVKGLGAASGSLGGNTDYQGISPLPVNLALSGGAVAPLLSSNETCAYALTLGAWPLVRNGFGAIHYVEQTKAIAIEGC
jgi:hypothetical protein